MSEYNRRNTPGHSGHEVPQTGGNTRSSVAPGKQTLVESLPQPVPASAVQRKATPQSPADGRAPDAQAAAAQGIAGSSGSLPFGASIQQLFGRHDVSGVQAHTDESAAAGARAMGADAFATGNHVAFASTPDLHTAAHEAAHVVQQRGGVQLKGGVGEAGDAHEQHANQVADRVVAGQSVEGLLDRYTGSSGAGSAASSHSRGPVQRQASPDPPSAPAPTAAPPSGTPAPPTGAPPSAVAPTAAATAPKPEAYHAPTSTHDPDAPASRNADWSHVQSAATDAHAQGALDIAWIEALPAQLKNSIDEAFADSVAAAAVQRASVNDSALKKIDQDIDKQEKDLQAATIERLAASDPSIKHKHGKQLEAVLASDQTFLNAKAELEGDRTSRKEERRGEIRAAADGPMAAGGRSDTVAKPDTAKITRLEGKALARTNFMSWAVDVLGSTEAAKRHFLSIRAVSRQPGMFLIEAAATRFEAARTAFEAKHAGYTFPSTDVAQSLRGFHQARQGIGMLGHALGIAFDFMAYDNPNQKLGETDNYGYLLDRMGGDGDKRGRSIMTLGYGGEDTVAQLGRDSAANKSSPAGEAMVEKIRTQFDEMVATSEQLRSSMTAHLQELSDARDDYFNSKDTEKQLAQATQDEKNADKIADKRLKDEKFAGDAEAKAARREEIKLELTKRKQKLKDDLDAAQASVKTGLANGFAEWSAIINADIGAVHARQATSDAEIAAHTKTKQELDAIDVHAPDALDALNTFADQHQLKKPKQPPRAATYKLILQQELSASKKPRDKSDPLSPAYIRAELDALVAWQGRLKSPKLVFGEGKVVPAAPTTGATATAPSGVAGPASAAPGASTPAGTGPTTATSPTAAPASTTPTPAAPGTAATPATASPAATTKHWATKMEVTNAPIMQFVEHGFIRHDEMPARQAGGGFKEVFNAEVATTLARFGFSPGAAFRDTMHFDFIEGYSASPGGRGQGNMNRDKYGPTGDIPPPAPTAATPKAAATPAASAPATKTPAPAASSPTKDTK